MHKPIHALTPVAAIVAAALLGGCSMHAKPTLTVASAQVTDRTDAGMVIDFLINAQNANEFELPLREATYTVWLNDTRVFKGVRSPEASLRRFGVQEVRLPAAIPSSINLPSGTVPYRIRGELSYVRPGALSEVLFDAGVITPSRSFSAKGTIDLDAPVTER
jgi:Late embryogenesis abundant protein